MCVGPGTGPTPSTTPSLVGISRVFNSGGECPQHTCERAGRESGQPPTHLTLQGAKEKNEPMAAWALSSSQEGMGVFWLTLEAWKENTEAVLGQL